METGRRALTVAYEIHGLNLKSSLAIGDPITAQGSPTHGSRFTQLKISSNCGALGDKAHVAIVPTTMTTKAFPISAKTVFIGSCGRMNRSF